MKVILLKAVPKIGKKDEIVEVNQGFANNALFPQRLAVQATEAALKALHERKQHTEADKLIRHNLLDRAIEAANGQSLVLKLPANDQGNLFSKVHEEMIADFLATEHRIVLDPSCINISEPIKKTGSHMVTITDGDYKATLTVEIVKK
jgi:large subunit ribosomal protein L9